ncbi:MAG: AAA family ATPase, partial [Nitrospirota bacterium]
MSDQGKSFPDDPPIVKVRTSSRPSADDPIVILDECLASLSDGDARVPLLYKLRHLLLQQGVSKQQQNTELEKLKTVVEKLTSPANRVGTLLELPEEGGARILVGGGEYYANVDPRLDSGELQLGTQILVNEAYVVIRGLGYEDNGPILKVREVLEDGRVRIDQEPGRQDLILRRASQLEEVHLNPGDEIRVDPTHRFVIERLEPARSHGHVLDEVPSVTWDQIGGQQQAIAAIRRAIEYPLLHAATFQRYDFTQPKGFLLHGPPGCGKTLIGQATAASLGNLVSQKKNEAANRGASDFPSGTQTEITSGVFLHIKGPEILNMWVGESERMLRDLFSRARQRRKEGLLPFIFIDEAESILGTRRALRSFNISNTLVPMFCAELDGIDSLRDVVVILSSNRPDLIDPAVLRAGRIDRKIKVGRPGRQEAKDIFRIYLRPELPLLAEPGTVPQDDPQAICDRLIAQTLEDVFQRTD